ncbi:DUF4394 domain-containing protein [Roseomonas eburnea]|uniref:DUF4394 domain-containing protein n=1 Tax=Neoroseomonas eburnea TaxID=1346889 RepID=A0A9X9XCN5_9PROT|nr:DUF4394 domain-containing protein [Neoroseomonas eburnea]MBR0681471.1 DUF4394 domain-containing protein [Neoroseomonas eburnea]
MTTTLRLALAACGMIAAVQAAGATTLLGLTADNALLRIDSETRRASAPMRITGTDGRVLGIDQRPQDGRLYGVTERGQIVAIDPATGRATQVSRLNTEFQSGGRATVDFNPVANRLRVMGVSGANLRVNVDTGEAVRDGTLKYAAGTPFAETPPRIVAGAYTNSIAGMQATALYTIDTLTRSFNLQAPPNDGVQQPRGEVAPTLPPGVAFDILADGQGGNTGFLLAGAALHRVNLETGAATVIGTVAGLPNIEVIDIAAMR